MKTNFKKISGWKVLKFKFKNNVLLSSYYRNYIRNINFKGDETVLELGAGTGAASKFLAAELKQKGKLICTDISEPLQIEARKVLKGFTNIEFKLGEVKSFDIPGNSIDFVFIHYVLHDIDKSLRQDTMNELYRCLKKGGRVLVREPVSRQHGMPPKDIEDIMAQTGLNKVRSDIRKVSVLKPESYTGVFNK